MKIVKSNFRWFFVFSIITIIGGLFPFLFGFFLTSRPLSDYAGTSPSKVIGDIVGILLSAGGLLVMIYGGLVLLFSYLAKVNYARNEKQIRTYRIFTAIACVIAALPTILDPVYWEVIFAVPVIGVGYTALILATIIINCRNAFTNRIWEEEKKTPEELFEGR